MFSKFRLYNFSLVPSLSNLRLISFLIYLFILFFFMVTCSFIFISFQILTAGEIISSSSTLVIYQSNAFWYLNLLQLYSTSYWLFFSYSLIFYLLFFYCIAFYLIFQFHLVYLTSKLSSKTTAFFLKSQIFANNLTYLTKPLLKKYSRTFFFLFFINFIQSRRDFLFFLDLPLNRRFFKFLCLFRLKYFLKFFSFFSYSFYFLIFCFCNIRYFFSCIYVYDVDFQFFFSLKYLLQLINFFIFL